MELIQRRVWASGGQRAAGARERCAESHRHEQLSAQLGL